MPFFSLGFSNHIINIHLNFLVHQIMNRVVIALWYVAPTFFNPKGITLKQNVPQGVINVIFSMSSEAILIWLYPKNPSMNKKTLNFAVLSTNISMSGNGKSSFGLALFRTILEIHGGYTDVTRKLELIFFRTSSLIFIANCLATSNAMILKW